MPRNLVYISALDGFAEDFPLGIETWKKYCERLGLDFYVETERDKVISNKVNGSWYPWSSYYLYDRFFDNVLIVDADTMVRWNAPNIFDVATADFNVVKDSSPLEYGAIPHLDQWRSSYHVSMPPENYFNAGMMVLSHDSYFKIRAGLSGFREVSESIGASSWGQTPVNLLAWENFGTSINYLPVIWNDMIGFNYEEGDTSFINRSFLWHFTGPNFQLDKVKRKRLMEQAYSLGAHNYEV